MMASDDDSTCHHCGVIVIKKARVLIDENIQRAFQQFLNEYELPPCGRSWLCRKCDRLLQTISRTKRALDARRREDSSSESANDHTLNPDNPSKKRKREPEPQIKPVSYKRMRQHMVMLLFTFLNSAH